MNKLKFREVWSLPESHTARKEWSWSLCTQTSVLCHLSESDSKSIVHCSVCVSTSSSGSWGPVSLVGRGQTPEDPLEASSAHFLPDFFPGSRVFLMLALPSPAWVLLQALPLHPKETGVGMLTSLLTPDSTTEEAGPRRRLTFKEARSFPPPTWPQFPHL